MNKATKLIILFLTLTVSLYSQQLNNLAFKMPIKKEIIVQNNDNKIDVKVVDCNFTIAVDTSKFGQSIIHTSEKETFLIIRGSSTKNKNIYDVFPMGKIEKREECVILYGMGLVRIYLN